MSASLNFTQLHTELTWTQADLIYLNDDLASQKLRLDQKKAVLLGLFAKSTDSKSDTSEATDISARIVQADMVKIENTIVQLGMRKYESERRIDIITEKIEIIVLEALPIIAGLLKSLPRAHGAAASAR